MGGGGGVLDIVKILLIFTFPKISKMLNIPFVDPGSMDFFASVIKKSVEMRRKDNVKKNDFIDLLIETLKNLEVR